MMITYKKFEQVKKKKKKIYMMKKKKIKKIQLQLLTQMIFLMKKKKIRKKSLSDIVKYQEEDKKVGQGEVR